MKKSCKRFFSAAVICAMLFGNTTAYADMINMNLYYDGKSHSYQAEEITIQINGQTMEVEDMPPIVLNDRTMVPARAVFETMGAEVTWNADTKEVYVKKDSDIVVLQIDHNTGTKNGAAFTMDVPAKIINDRTLIPVRAVSEALGCEVGWDDSTRVVSIDETENTPILEPETDNTDTNTNTNTDTNTNTNTDTNTNANANTNANTNTNNNTNTNTSQDTGVVPTQNISVTGISVPTGNNNQQVFTVTASGEIAKYENVYVDDTRIVLDIYYAQKNLSSDNITVTTSPFVSAVRSAQHDVDGVAVTRVVLDLKAPVKYQLSQSADKKSLVVAFSESIVQSMTVTNNGTTDTVQINANAPLAANVSTLSSPKRIVIDIAYATSNLQETFSTEGLSQITAIRTSMYEQKTPRVVLEVKDTAEYEINQSGNSIVVTVKKSTLDNLSYDASKKALVLKKVTPFDINTVVHTDNYLQNHYKIELPGDFTSVYGYGTMKLDYDGVPSVTVATESGKTAFRFDQTKIRAYTITEDTNNYYINIKNPKEVYDRVLLLDAGHGGNDPGTSGNGLNEKDINLAIVNKAYALLQQTDKVKTYLTRTDDTRPENRDRANMANDMADVFISIHMNSAAPNPTPNGTEVLFITHANDVQGKLTSQIVATEILQKMIAALQTNNRGLKYDTQHQKNLIVLNSTTVPAVIVETVFLSNPGDALKISNETNQDKAAQAIYDTVIDLANKYNWR